MHIAESLIALELGVIYGLVAVGVYLAFEVLAFSDLTCDGSFVLGGVVAVVLFNSGFGELASLFIAFTVGAISGVITALLNIYCKLSDLLSGIIVAFVMYSVNLRIMGGVPNITIADPGSIFGNDFSLYYTMLLVSMVVLLLVFLMKTDFGLAIMSVGQNRGLARAMGVNIELFIVSGLAISNGMVALSGGILSYNQSFVDVSQGVGTVIFGLVAATIGSALFPVHALWLRFLACVIGAVLYRLSVALAINSNFLGFKASDINLVTGAVVVLVIFLRRKFSGVKFKER